jgi:hypothetical protein
VSLELTAAVPCRVGGFATPVVARSRDAAGIEDALAPERLRRGLELDREAGVGLAAAMDLDVQEALAPGRSRASPPVWETPCRGLR